MAGEAENPDGFILLIIGAFGVSTVVLIVGCAWCRKKWRKFYEKRLHRFSLNRIIVPPVQNVTEFSLFPPQSTSNRLSSPGTVSAAIPDKVVFEPLPEIRSRTLQAVAQNVRPARFTGSCRKVSLQDWFDELQYNFPRNQLKYLREVGSAWYGQAVEGEAYDIIPNEEKTKTVVKILRIDSSALDLMHFLQETQHLRDLYHPNLLRLLGRCLEVHPFLLIMEHCDMDLKTCLIQQRKTPEVLLSDGLLLRMACNIASALQHMHENGYIHTDIAAHSCLVTSDFTVKIGDYGTALHAFKCDYYILGDIAFPLRWCAPESLLCTESIVEAKDITREANIWSFGVLLWELLEFGKLPYIEYSDEEVVQKVMIERSLKLEQPKTPCVHSDMMFKVMQLCWHSVNERPSIQKVLLLLSYLYDNKDVVSESTDFESRWNSLQPVIRDHSIQMDGMPHVSLKFESDFNSRNDQPAVRDCDSIISSDFCPSQYGDKSPSRCSFSLGYETGLLTDISPSLQNLRGSIEDLASSSSMTVVQADPHENHSNTGNVEITQEHITNAIRDLDDVLADEITSSEASKCTTPERYPSDDFHQSSAAKPQCAVNNDENHVNNILTDNFEKSKEDSGFQSEVSEQNSQKCLSSDVLKENLTKDSVSIEHSVNIENCTNPNDVIDTCSKSNHLY